MKHTYAQQQLDKIRNRTRTIPQIKDIEDITTNIELLWGNADYTKTEVIIMTLLDMAWLRDQEGDHNDTREI